jgi:hypothetical protein
MLSTTLQEKPPTLVCKAPCHFSQSVLSCGSLLCLLSSSAIIFPEYPNLLPSLNSSHSYTLYLDLTSLGFCMACFSMSPVQRAPLSMTAPPPLPNSVSDSPVACESILPLQIYYQKLRSLYYILVGNSVYSYKSQEGANTWIITLLYLTSLTFFSNLKNFL